jgi:hypothetical protein
MQLLQANDVSEKQVVVAGLLIVSAVALVEDSVDKFLSEYHVK